ncbi:hypothetical protein [Jatrophihabitans sp.]|uniref:hypothetical protein n=1 Tax=Jatrophihabitans sp. TaxID=1932789 RepID=UPI0030C6D237|nr:hypothetical protein [Jatrophihabitans sp.]
MFIPQPVGGSAVGFVVTDFGARDVDGRIATPGDIDYIYQLTGESPSIVHPPRIATFGTVPDGQVWLFERLLVTADVAKEGDVILAYPTCYVVRGAANGSVLDFTPLGDHDIGEYEPPIVVQATDELLVIWDTVLGTGNATVSGQWTVLQQRETP